MVTLCPRFSYCRAVDKCPLTDLAKQNYGLPEDATCPGARSLQILEQGYRRRV